MENKKPNVIPDENSDGIKSSVDMRRLMAEANETSELLSKQMREEGKSFIKPLMSDEDYKKAMEIAKKRDEILFNKKTEISGDDSHLDYPKKSEPTNGESNAIAEMARQRELETKQFAERGRVVREELAEKVDDGVTLEYGDESNKTQPIRITKPNYNDFLVDEKESMVEEPYDLIPLPSEGKIYSHKKTHLKVAYMNASDEDVLTNPNLLESGKMLDVLFSRKIKEPGFNYRKLHVGDRNAIMLWLRATAYGTDYPVEIVDPKTEDIFKVNVDLSQLKTKYLGEDPDENGLFTYTTLNSDVIKYKLLNIEDEEAIDDHAEALREKKTGVFDLSTFTLRKHLVSVNDNDSVDYLNDYVKVIRIMDARNIRKKINEIESGIDMKIKVTTPGGESLTTFLPLNVSFFYPDFGA